MTFKTNFRSEVMPDGKVVVYDVPIFGDCEKAGIHFDDAWMDQAVKYHQQGEANGIAWAMHIHHTGEDGRPVLPAGAWTNTRKGWIRTKNGERVVGVICDLVFTDETAAKRAKLGQLLWRSPEIPMSAATGQTSPRFKSLALLDRDAPHNDDLPILTFKGASVHFRKKAVGLVSGASVGRDPVLAFADTGDSFFALMEPTAMATKTGKLKFEEEDKDPPASESESSESSESKPEGESKGGGWKAKIEALKGIKLEAEEIPEFLAALKECADAIGGETTPEAEEEPPELDPNVDEAADPIGEMP
ncbi:MAG TPA: hypothetical protein VM223_12995, partial [Planctomycetota bacterium]|nr:hypothetical protein [Planctomycetota bacterium]